MVKIESLNPINITGKDLPAGKTVNTVQPAILAQDKVSAAHPTTNNTDSVNLSIPNLQSDKNLSNLLSNLIGVLKVGAGLVPAQEGKPLLESLFYKGEEPLSFLKDFIEKSGLLYEAKIARGDIKAIDEDLKGLLLRLVEKMGEKSEGGKAASVLLNDIEARQLLNVKAKDDGALYLQIPVLLPQGPSTAEVQVRRDGKGKGGYEQDVYNIGFCLELREAGLLSVSAIINRSNVSIRLQAEKAEFLEYMKSRLPELSERLAGYGVTLSLKLE